MTRRRALMMGLLVCLCGHRENNHFTEPGTQCAFCGCLRYRETGIRGVAIITLGRPE